MEDFSSDGINLMNARSEATKQGIARTRMRGRQLGAPFKATDAEIRAVMHLPTREARKKVGLSKSQYLFRRRAIEEKESNSAAT
jgi:hypothetical protein